MRLLCVSDEKSSCSVYSLNEGGAENLGEQILAVCDTYHDT